MVLASISEERCTQECRTDLRNRAHNGMECLPCGLDDVPDIFDSVTEFAARHTGTQAVIADANCIVLEGICEVILALGHCAYEDAYTLLLT